MRCQVVRLRSAAVAAGVVVLGGFSLACGVGSKPASDSHGPGDVTASTSSAPAASPSSGTHTVVFAAQTSDGSQMNVSYGLGGDSSDANGSASPWSKTSTTTEAVTTASVVAQSQGDGDGSVSCSITVDGKVVKTNQSTGAYAVVTCTYASF